MNVLILTPDAVGSTLLQRLVTIYMQFHSFDRPVINLHELTNGLVKYHNPAFGQEILGKRDGAWGYHQSLKEVVDLLDSVDHYKTSRLAHYHIRNRQDNISDQIAFYQYLNDNFYIISCRRHNIFEHALSWCLSKVTKKLNVYDDQEKINSFFDLYKNGINLDPNSLIQTLNAYRDYIEWCNNHFNVANYFYYEEHLPRIENYILNLPIFSNQTQKLSWKKNFGISFDHWNMCHYLKSDLGYLALNQPEQFAQLSNNVQRIRQSEFNLIESYNKVKDPSWPEIKSTQDYMNLPTHIRQEVEQVHGIKIQADSNIIVKTEFDQPLINYLPSEHQNFVNAHRQSYDSAMSQIKMLVKTGIMISAPPIKKQTFAEKKHMIRNYQNLLKTYNQWIERNPDLGSPIDDQTLDQFAEIESSRWNPASSAIALSDQQNNC